jgi:hypothetical protein
VESLFAAMESTAVAEYLRMSRWSYAAVNTAHILGITLLVGSIIPFNLHSLGLWRNIPRLILARVLLPVAATGLVLAVMAGSLLFSVNATQYAGIGFFQVKIVLVVLGTLSAWWLYRRYGLLLEGATEPQLRVHALLSTLCWLSALVCGRLVAFVE